MNAKLQLISFLLSFVYGIIFYLLTSLNFKLIEKMRVLYKHIITFIFVLDIAIIYIIIMYHLNKGYFHIYFILMVLIGFIAGYFLKTKIFSKIDVKRHFMNWNNIFFVLVSELDRYKKEILCIRKVKKKEKDFF